MKSPILTNLLKNHIKSPEISILLAKTIFHGCIGNAKELAANSYLELSKVFLEIMLDNTSTKPLSKPLLTDLWNNIPKDKNAKIDFDLINHIFKAHVIDKISFRINHTIPLNRTEQAIEIFYFMQLAKICDQLSPTLLFTQRYQSCISLQNPLLVVNLQLEIDNFLKLKDQEFLAKPQHSNQQSNQEAKSLDTIYEILSPTNNM